jgi:hypothetical protein
MKRLDQDHLHYKLEVPRLTSVWNRTRAFAVGGKHSSKELFEQRVNSYSEHLHMSARPVENARDNNIIIISIILLYVAGDIKDGAYSAQENHHPQQEGRHPPDHAQSPQESPDQEN